MERRKYRIYCAGPLFNPKEREEMAQIASALEVAGYPLFLPQRDGLEFAVLFPSFIKRGIPAQEAKDILNMAIFSLDIFQVTACDGLLLNMNGRVPDEGAMVEAGIAWAHSKVVVIFRSDSRSLMEGNCNPLVLGLSDFRSVSTYEAIPGAFDAQFAVVAENVLVAHEYGFAAATKNGKEISDYLASRKSESDIADLLIDLFGERICQRSDGLKRNSTRASMRP